MHDGPVPGNISFSELSIVREEFIIGCGWGTQEDVKKHFAERYNELNSINKYDKVILWFEHDLYDQLHLLQILDWFQENKQNKLELSIICTDRYLGALSPDEMNGLFKFEESITEEHLRIANIAWSAFRASSPEQWHDLLDMNTDILPFLKGSIIRLLEEYPSAENGVSRTAQQALRIISEGEARPGRVFGRSQELEDRVFLGDSCFWDILHEFLASSPPLLELPKGKKLTLPTSADQELTITQAGKDVLSGKLNWLDISAPDRWIGGVHITPRNSWCWDSDSALLVRRARREPGEVP